jgi:membrane protein implicated in regulation of membrane protease activity
MKYTKGGEKVIEKAANAGRILVMMFFTVWVGKTFKFPFLDWHYALLEYFAVMGVLYVLFGEYLKSGNYKTAEKIQRIWEVKKVEVDGNYPKLIKRG